MNNQTVTALKLCSMDSSRYIGSNCQASSRTPDLMMGLGSKYIQGLGRATGKDPAHSNALYFI